MDELSVFLEALQKETPEERTAFLDEVCGSDEQIRHEVEMLLRAHEKVGDFLQGTPIGIGNTIDQPITERPGTQIGPYKLLQQIGEGGMGVVYMAEQTEPVERRVALKIIKPGMDTRKVIARFEAERQALAMMDHPNIAKVLDAGTAETGRPYFVMELVKGIPVTQFCDDKQLTPRERLELFVPICQAVQHAHQKGIIHRDVKPSNVLVAEYDDNAVPKIIDFGIAKAIDQRLTEKTLFTHLGQVVGTVEYMSPEQAKLNQLDIDTRSDIYSLGVLLYELLTGEMPFDRERLRSAAFDELLRIIREEEPPRPSTRLSTSASLPSIAANRHTEPSKLSTLVRGELDWIVMKALEKDRARRYGTASDFAADVDRFLNDELVHACPPTRLYRAQKYVKQHKAGLAMATVLSVALMTTAIFGIRFHQQNRELLLADTDRRARAALAAGEFKRAREHFTKLVSLQKRAYGAMSQHTLRSQFDLAGVLGKLKQYTDAADLYGSTLDAQARLLDESHPDTQATLKSLFNLDLVAARHYMNDGEKATSAQAVDLSQRALDLAKQPRWKRWRVAQDSSSKRAYEYLIKALYQNGEFQRCHETARHYLGLRTSYASHSLYLRMALVNWAEGRPELANDWFLATDQLRIGNGGAWRITQKQLRDEAARHILGSADAILPELSTTEEEELYTRLLAEYPQAAYMRQRRGYCCVQLGRWDEAARDFAECARQHPDGNIYLHACHALLSLHENRALEYQSQCQWLVKFLAVDRPGGDHRVTAGIVCMVSPSKALDYEKISGLVGANTLAKGMAAYRCGNYPLALQLLKNKGTGIRLALNRLFEAMAHQRRGEGTEARAKLAEARAILDEKCPRPGRPKEDETVSYFTSVVWCEALVVLSEAEALIEGE